MRLSIVVCLIFQLTLSMAQSQKDSLRQSIGQINQIYPAIRPYSIQFESPSNRNYETELFDKDFEHGEITENYRIRSFGTFPVLRSEKIILTGSINHLYQHVEMMDVNNISNSYPSLSHSQKFDLHDVTLSVSAIRKDSIGNKLFIFSSSAMVNSRNLKSIEKFKMLFSASVILSASRNTVITAGVAGFIDPSAILPFFPMFSYWHKFPQSQWQLDFILPSRLCVRHPVLSKGWFTAGTELSGTHSFSTPNAPFLTGDYEHSSLMIQSGVNFEYPIASNLLFGLKSGIENTVTSRMVKVNEKSTNYVGSNKMDPALYFNVSLSFVPGLKVKK